MCAINPKHQHHFKLSVYTSLNVTPEQFENYVMHKLLELEAKLNEDARLRWHITEMP